ncbi:flagellar protein export ATPase FliI [Candidatus Methylospira mobilis]|uniref:Flagellum-specific ATP synthase n=1 Tax=Candidatus Methylospira mobilis TaxID=1808979 RepID=A0A5Q0BDE0_9GAMM|nr:flagellar protein export ATPase FliI [Candidatus Methylospira mobilis]QFY41865.1 flagellar protein export ATPase FliI [Candidatus Methylospira mobilis]WNV06742.1 flagellar protein export ATPase FliI [Candidatus Methylospira mobilis]
MTDGVNASPPPTLHRWARGFAATHARLNGLDTIRTSGRITRVTGLVMEAVGLQLPIGAACSIPMPNGNNVDAEVVGFEGNTLFLMPHSEVEGILPGTPVYVQEYACLPPSARELDEGASPVNSHARRLPVGMALLGRVLDGAGKPLDGGGPIHTEQLAQLTGRIINPLARTPITEIADVGVRAINGLLTVGRGQRMGLFAGSGVGKSVLLAMMARYTTADIIVVGLIGERGREVKEFIEHNLGEEGLARSVVIAAPADAPPLLRLQGASYATAIAEFFRDEGHDVLLIMDSLTRYAMAQREIALSLGEPPATKGYPPSVFAKLPALVERAGNGMEGGGSITAFYTVLTEGDDQQDPIADAARAILDGHIVLNRSLAESGHYPAIDVEQSISRVMQAITTPEHLNLARRLKQLYSRYERARDLIRVGAYVAGTDPVLDEAIHRRDDIAAYLQQGINERSDVTESLSRLSALFA